jgi:hypothetical protein
MTTRLKLIRQVEVGRYRVELETSDSASTSFFMFSVEEGDIQVVKSPPDFVEHMKYQMGPASPLMEAVLAFHRAQSLEFPA